MLLIVERLQGATPWRGPPLRRHVEPIAMNDNE
jgi:hypothetical protein